MKGFSYIIVICVIIFSISCGTEKGIVLPINGSKGKSQLLIEIPEGFRVSKNTGDHGFSENLYSYPDGSILFITNVFDSGSYTNHDNRLKKYGKGINLKFAISDSLDIQGEREGLFWREIKNQYAVFGYINVPPEKKDLFDDIVENRVSIK